MLEPPAFAPATDEENILDAVRALALPDLHPASDLGQRPEFVWIPLDWLLLDRRFQRRAGTETSKVLIRRIAEAFNWKKFAPIVVTETGRRDGKYSIVDGQHRARGAALHGSITEMPAWVISAPELKEAAASFVGINKDRSIVQPLALYRAQLAAGDADALAIEACCRDAGGTVVYALTVKARKAELPARTTQAISTLCSLLQRRGAGVITVALSILADACPTTPNQLRGSMISAVTELLARRGDQVDRARLIKVLSERDADELAAAAKNAKQLLNCSTTDAMVEALTRDYDKGLPDARRLSAARSTDVTPATLRAASGAPSIIEPPSKARLMAGR